MKLTFKIEAKTFTEEEFIFVCKENFQKANRTWYLPGVELHLFGVKVVKSNNKSFQQM